MEKKQLALGSFLVALVMTALKAGVGIASGSLGILSDAAHAAIDTLAVFLTYLAVRVADTPADRDHTYGHGRIESLAALLQTIVLLLACLWIVREAAERIVFKEARVEATWWAFAMMALSIVVNFSRARALRDAAQKYSSQALEADAYHFRVDMLTDGLVIIGLVCARIGEALQLPHFAVTADAVAAIGIVGITVYLSLRLGKRAFDSLMDRAPTGAVELVKQEVERIEGVLDAHEIRVRRAGATVFVDLHVSVPRSLSSERSHAITEIVEQRVQQVVPNSEVLVHVEPIRTDDESVHERIRLIARNHAMTVHNIHVYHEHNRVNADLHLEVSDKLDLNQAHSEASKLQHFIRQELPEIAGVNVHIEGRGQQVGEGDDVTVIEAALVETIRQAVARKTEIRSTHNIHVRRIGGERCVYVHCAFAQDAGIARVHDLSTELEQEIMAMFPDLGRIVIHAEPDAHSRGDSL